MTKAVRLGRVAIVFLLLHKVLILKPHKQFPKFGHAAQPHLDVR